MMPETNLILLFKSFLNGWSQSLENHILYITCVKRRSRLVYPSYTLSRRESNKFQDMEMKVSISQSVVNEWSQPLEIHMFIIAHISLYSCGLEYNGIHRCFKWYLYDSYVDNLSSIAILLFYEYVQCKYVCTFFAYVGILSMMAHHLQQGYHIMDIS